MDIYNAERYLDLTAATALANVTREERAKEKRYRPLVYICSPYAGDTERNVNRARGYCRFAVSEGYIPIAPHLHFPQFMDDDDHDQRELGLFFALVLLGKCEELWVFGDYLSNGMLREIDRAKGRDIAVRYFTDKCKET